MRKNILITGASSGLGRDMARQFAARHRNLALCARRLSRLTDLQHELSATYPNLQIHIRELDVCQYDQVFTVFRELASELGGLDRIIVNAGVSKGQPLGCGQFSSNRQIAETNFVAALAQVEAALELFRAQRKGHLVTVASVAAVRGLPGTMSTYAASKAALATLSEGARAELFNTPIRVTTLFPGFIRSEMTAERPDSPLMADAASGVRALVRAIEKESAEAFVPAWPWAALAPVLRRLPMRLLQRVDKQGATQPDR